MRPISTNQRILEEYVRKKVYALNSNINVGDLTVGVEHEFFLVDRLGNPSSLDLSQEFLHHLSQTPKWRVFTQKTDAKPGSGLLSSVSAEGKNKGFTVVKYEHPASLMEIAFGYHVTLHELKEDIYSTWEAVENAAQRLNCRVHSVPIFRPAEAQAKDAGRLSSIYRELSCSRRACFARRQEPVDESVVDFSTFTAATQVQVGGLQWWNPDSILNILYKTEWALQAIPYLLACETQDSARALCRERWNLYHGVFKGMKLLGFPDLPEWSFSAWISALLESPLVEIAAGPATNGYLKDRSISPAEMDSIFPRIRDLTIMKPKLIGTVEFRADPAMPGPEEILTLAGLRLGQCILANKLRHKSFPNGPFKDALSRSFADCRQEWWRNVEHLSIPPNHSEPVIEQILNCLEERELLEHRIIKRGIA